MEGSGDAVVADDEVLGEKRVAEVMKSKGEDVFEGGK